MFRRILLATDLSNATERALEFAAALARRHDARLIVLHVYAVSASSMAGWSAEEAERTWPGAIRARGELEQVVRALRAAGARAQAAIAFGMPAKTIVEVAAAEQVDLVVTGTHGRTGLPRALYGSVAEEVVRLSDTPVVAVPMGAARVIDLQSRRAAGTRRSGPQGGSGAGG